MNPDQVRFSRDGLRPAEPVMAEIAAGTFTGNIVFGRSARRCCVRHDGAPPLFAVRTREMTLSGMIELNANVPDHFLVLERKETFGDYARTYGKALAEHYENRGVIVVPFMPITFDLALFQSIPFPLEWKKIGTENGIEESVFVREGTKLPTGRIIRFAGSKWARNGRLTCSPRSPVSIGSSAADCKCCFRFIDSLQDVNITWRLTETREEGMHLDYFDGGAPTMPGAKLAHGAKISHQPRQRTAALAHVF